MITVHHFYVKTSYDQLIPINDLLCCFSNFIHFFYRCASFSLYFKHALWFTSKVTSSFQFPDAILAEQDRFPIEVDQPSELQLFKNISLANRPPNFPISFNGPAVLLVGNQICIDLT